jgi:SH3 domain protein
MKRLRLCVAIGAALFASIVLAETLYVTDQVTVGLRADATPDSAVLATASTGAALEVLERSGSVVRVRNGNGVEGWVDAAALATEPPAAQRLGALRAELDRTRAQLANTQGLLEKARAVSPAPGANADKLQSELTGAHAQLDELHAELKKKNEELTAATAARDAAVKEAAVYREAAAREAGRQAATQTLSVPQQAPQAPASVAESGFSFVWVAVAFAMLLIGFIGGIVWVKESIRRRMGGMYLRV